MSTWTANLKHHSRNELQGCVRLIRMSVAERCAVDHLNDTATIDAWVRGAAHDLVMADRAIVARTFLANAAASALVGVAAASFTDDGVRLMVNYTHPVVRCGAGTVMLEALEAWGKDYGCTDMVLFSSAAGREFYTRNGYAVDGAPEKGNGVSWNFPMRKKLLPAVPENRPVMPLPSAIPANPVPVFDFTDEAAFNGC